MIGTNRQGDVRNTIGNGEAKELVCITHGHEVRWGECWRVWGCAGQRYDKGEKKIGTTVIA